MFNLGVHTKKDAVNYDEVYDFVALGLGPAGLSAGIYAGRKGLKTLVLGHDFGGQLKNTSEIDNYLGFGLVDAPLLIVKFKEHVNELKIPLLTDVLVTSIVKDENNLFMVALNNGKTIKTKTLLYALGGNPRKLGVLGEEEFAGKGISYCVTCDGPFYRGKDVIVAGGGNSALDGALDLARTSKSVTIVQRSILRADQKSIDKFLSLPNTKIVLQTDILELVGEFNLKNVRVYDKVAKKEGIIPTDAVFVEIGNIPNTALLKELVELNESGEVVVTNYQETSLEGLYAAGDITAGSQRQIIIAASEGAKAAIQAAQYLNNH